jgi:Fic family protein
MLSVLIGTIEEKKVQLDRLRPITPQALVNLDLELTYASNAIEGNTLTQAETNLVIEKGVTIGGKTLKEHLEAIDHYEAIGYVRELARQSTPLAESDVRGLHALAMKRSAPGVARRYATSGRYVNTDAGRHVFPAPAVVPALMGDFAAWLHAAPAAPEAAFSAHRRLVAIHPFDAGNGRTARPLMNLILIRGAYPPVTVRPEHRLAYLRALQRDQAGEGDEDFRRLLYERLDAALDDYLNALRSALPS